MSEKRLAPKNQKDYTGKGLSTDMRRAIYREAREKLYTGIIHFFNEQPLFYLMLSRMVRMPDPSIGTIGVGFKNIQVAELFTTAVTLYYNPFYIIEQSEKKIQIILNHECQHVGLKHLIRMMNYEPYLYNVAADVIVNHNIPEIKNLPAGEWDGIDQSHIEVLKNRDVREMTAEQIYGLMKPKYDEIKKKLQALIDAGLLNPDDHTQWGSQNDGEGAENGRGTISPEEAAALDTLIRDSVRSLKGKNPGNLPGNMKRMIDEMMKTKVNWRQLMNMFVQNVVREETESSWRRVNRRMLGAGHGYVSPGRRKLYKPNILIAVDNSGSIHGKIYNLFMAQVMKIVESAESCKMIGIDTRVNFEEDVTNKKFPEDFDLRSGGGTDFQPAFDYAKEHNFNAVIYLTDGYANHAINTYGKQCLFAISPGGAEVQGYRNIRLEEDG